MWPFIKTAAPLSPFGPQGYQLFDTGDAAARAPIMPGVVPPPFNPYSHKYLAARSFNPQAPATRAVAVVLPVSLRGGGIRLTGAIYYAPLLDPATKTGILT